MSNSNRKVKRNQSGQSAGLLLSQKLGLSLGLMSIVTLIIIALVNKFYFYENYTQDNLGHQEESDSIFNHLENAMKPFGDGSQWPMDQMFERGPVWGSLNSAHYFSLKLSSPNSLETSLLWFENELNQQGRLDVRHMCDQNDRVDHYSWVRHDFHSFGEQEIQDKNYRISTSFIKNPDNHLEWKAKVDVEFLTETSKPISLIQYITISDNNDHLELKSHPSKNSQTFDRGSFSLKGHSKDVGNFEVHIIGESIENIISANYLSGRVDKERYPISPFIQSQLVVHKHNGTSLYVLPGDKISRQQQQYHSEPVDQPNIIAYQMIFKGSGSMFIELRQSHSNSFKPLEVEFDGLINKKRSDFDSKFAQLFPIESPNVSLNKMAKIALSNMIGSVGYFYGSSFISSDINPNRIAPYGPIQLLTGVPSRPFFPRGFLWDEAFHNLLISRWDPGLSNKIINSWFNIMNVNGWIPREVILGIEAMRRVPQEFIVQRITNANPPAMFIVIERMLELGTLERSNLEKIYPRLKQWYNWFNLTQFGPKPGTYRWRGRDEFSTTMLNPKTLTSGLDDYPRPSHPSPLEYHVDLRCWMALAARTLTKLSKTMNDDSYNDKISLEAAQLLDNQRLEELHWSEPGRMFCDYGYNSDNAELIWVTKTRKIKGGQGGETYRVLERHSVGHPKFECVREFGYVSLFPMLLNILDPKSDKLGIMLDRLRNDDEIWSPYGIRSLSKLSKYYNKYNTEHDKPYWRGAIWININYLLLSSLESYSKLDGPYKERCAELFTELKANLVNNLVEQFAKSNMLWENYDDGTGQGKGSHPFTGWSSLILLIMSSNVK